MKKYILNIWNYLSKTEKEIIKGIIFILSFSLFINYFQFSEDNVKIGIYVFFGLLIGYGVFFKTTQIENFLIQNITKISFLLIVSFFLMPANFVNLNKEIFYIIGAIFAFWYGYKKYERNQELVLIKEYSDNYDKINIENNRKKILNFWFKEFYLYKQGYIDKRLWGIWSYYIEDKVFREIFAELSYLMNIEDIEKQNELKNKKIPFLEELKDFKRISNSGKTLEVINEKEDDIIEEFIIFILKRLKGFFLIKVKQDEGEIYGAFLIKDWYSYIEKEINYFIKDNSEEDKKTMKETYKIINN